MLWLDAERMGRLLPPLDLPTVDLQCDMRGQPVIAP
jgi:hypothetical protein